MSRARPRPRSGDFSKAVMVGIMGRLLSAEMSYPKDERASGFTTAARHFLSPAASSAPLRLGPVANPGLFCESRSGMLAIPEDTRKARQVFRSVAYPIAEPSSGGSDDAA